MRKELFHIKIVIYKITTKKRVNSLGSTDKSIYLRSSFLIVCLFFSCTTIPPGVQDFLFITIPLNKSIPPFTSFRLPFQRSQLQNPSNSC